MDGRKVEIDSLITQWKQLCGYLEKLDTTYGNAFAIVFAAFGLLSVINANSTESQIGAFVLFWIVPMALTLLLYYQAYLLREATILKGYLFILEKRINLLISDYKDTRYNDIFCWFKEYDVAFMSKNNLANRIMPFPVMMAIIIVYVFLMINNSESGVSILYITYIALLLSFSVIALISIFINARRQTQSRNNESVKESANKGIDHYLKKYGNKHLQ